MRILRQRLSLLICSAVLRAVELVVFRAQTLEWERRFATFIPLLPTGKSVVQGANRRFRSRLQAITRDTRRRLRAESASRVLHRGGHVVPDEEPVTLPSPA